MKTILHFFFDNPYQKFYLRQIASLLHISPSVAKKELDNLSQNKILTEIKIANNRFFQANMDNKIFIYQKIAYNLEILNNFQLIDQILHKYPNISSITLYGSLAKGLNDKHSDIDILIIAPYTHINIDTAHKLSIKTMQWHQWKQYKNTPFYQEVIIYGITLHGEHPIL